MTKRRTEEKTSSIHSTLRWAIVVYQVFGFMPVSGILASDPAEMKFSWKSSRTIYALFTTAGCAFLIAVQLMRFCFYAVHMADVMRMWYFLRALGTGIFFIHLARNWSVFSDRWARVDRAMRSYKVLKGSKGKAQVVTAIFLVLFIVDYSLIQIQRVSSQSSWTKMMMDIKTWDNVQKKLRFPYVYQLLKYDSFSGIILLVVQAQVLITGTFLDLFIILTSICLASRMVQIENRIRLLSKSIVPISAWTEVREDYNRLERLVAFVNSKIGIATLLSFAGNLGNILIQLYNTLEPKNTLTAKLYLYYSFAFLLTKTLAMCLIGSKLNEESRKPLAYLHRTPDVTYNDEIDRLIRQISRDTMALSGMNFFYIRRNLVLKIAGSIVTYELVLMQFAGDYLREHDIVNRTTSL